MCSSRAPTLLRSAPSSAARSNGRAGASSGDWGGGSDLGLAAIGAAVRAADGRGPGTVLESVVSKHFGMRGPLEVSLALFAGDLAESRLSELAALVLAESDEDAVAASIVARLAGEVVAFARAALSRLRLEAADPDVVLGGRLLRLAPPGLVQTVEHGVQAVAPRARIVVPRSEPIVGAALLGLDVLGSDPRAHARAREELDAAMGALTA
jgi:N-acetylglucosamine kinase-like BadF-type ATPase